MLLFRRLLWRLLCSTMSKLWRPKLVRKASIKLRLLRRSWRWRPPGSLSKWCSTRLTPSLSKGTCSRMMSKISRSGSSGQRNSLRPAEGFFEKRRKDWSSSRNASSCSSRIWWCGGWSRPPGSLILLEGLEDPVVKNVISDVPLVVSLSPDEDLLI